MTPIADEWSPPDGPVMPVFGVARLAGIQPQDPHLGAGCFYSSQRDAMSATDRLLGVRLGCHRRGIACTVAAVVSKDFSPPEARRP